jgi:hypothetical protein
MGCLAPATADAGTVPRVFTQKTGHSFRVRPAWIGISGDGTIYLGHLDPRDKRGAHRGRLHWKTWKRRSAYATGPIWLNDCEPNCAYGSFHKARSTVRARRVRHGRFTRLIVRYRDGGHRRVLRRALAYAPPWEYGDGYYYWTTP